MIISKVRLESKGYVDPICIEWEEQEAYINLHPILGQTKVIKLSSAPLASNDSFGEQMFSGLRRINHNVIRRKFSGQEPPKFQRNPGSTNSNLENYYASLTTINGQSSVLFGFVITKPSSPGTSSFVNNMLKL